MHKEIVVNVSSNEVRVGLLEDHQLVEVLVERSDARRTVGNVYKGLVTAVRPGLQAAFVDIGLDKAGFLHVSDLIHDESQEDDAGRSRGREREAGGPRGGSPRRGRMRGRENLRSIETMLREGDEILVQVTKEVIGTKGPRLTADLSLPGRFLVMMPKGSHVGVSRKIEDRGERARLRDMLAALKPEGPGAYIIRTAGVGVTDKMLQRDVEYLSGLWEKIGENAKLQKAPSLVHEDVGLIVGLVRDILKEDVNALHIDDKDEYERLLRYVKHFSPELKSRIQLFRGNGAIFDAFGIEAELKKSLDKKVWLNRGGFLVIEQTEALVAIDVNTGRFTGKRNQEETILRANMMAAREIPRQLRLRDIGGIIVIDFIDMENEADKRKVLAELRSQLRYDRARTKTFAVSDLGLVEMSRQRVRQSVRDILSDECPYCRATGKVLSIETLANKVQRMLEKVPLICKDRAVQVQAGPQLALELMVDRAEAMAEISHATGIKINVVDDPRLHREEFRIVALQSRRDIVADLESSGRPAVRTERPEVREVEADERSGRAEHRDRRDRPERAQRGERRRGSRRDAEERPEMGEPREARVEAGARPEREGARSDRRPRGPRVPRVEVAAAASTVERVVNPLDRLREETAPDTQPLGEGEAPARRRRRRGGRGRRRRQLGDGPENAGLDAQPRSQPSERLDRDEMPPARRDQAVAGRDSVSPAEPDEFAEPFGSPFAEGKAPRRRSRRRRGGRGGEVGEAGEAREQVERTEFGRPPDDDAQSARETEPFTPPAPRPLGEARELPQHVDTAPSSESSAPQEAAASAMQSGGRRPRRRARRSRRRGSSETNVDGAEGEGSGPVGVAATAEAGAID